LEKHGRGLTVLDVEVGNPANPETTEKIEFLFDSGAIYSVGPAPVLDNLGIRPLATQEFRLVDGSRVARKKGGAVFRYGERVGVADVIFGEEGDSTLLGALIAVPLLYVRGQESARTEEVLQSAEVEREQQRGMAMED
jgi:hypothetical protein